MIDQAKEFIERCKEYGDGHGVSIPVEVPLLKAMAEHFVRHQSAQAIVQAEFSYWHGSREHMNGGDGDLLVIGSIGACSNILLGVLGHLSPWHPGYDAQQEARKSDADLEEAETVEFSDHHGADMPGFFDRKGE